MVRTSFVSTIPKATESIIKCTIIVSNSMNRNLNKVTANFLPASIHNNASAYTYKNAESAEATEIYLNEK